MECFLVFFEDEVCTDQTVAYTCLCIIVYHCMHTSCVVFNEKRDKINGSLINGLTFLKVEQFAYPIMLFQLSVLALV